MGECTEAAYFLAMQYAHHEMEYLEKEIAHFERILDALVKMEKAQMIVVESSYHAELFKSFKGALKTLSNHRAKERIRNAKAKSRASL